jgi:ribosome-associated protein
MLQVSSKIRIPNSELKFTFVRSSGPGGQNVNKLNTKAVLRWAAQTSSSVPPDVLDRFLTRYRNRVTADGAVLISSQRFRNQSRNAADCLDKLRNMLAAVAAAPVPRRATKPPRAAVERRLATKQARAQKKQRRQVVRFEE